ncbi:hypothetical protein KJ966_22935 [bacterium]|nr:hypothetical protein [bacterium]
MKYIHRRISVTDQNDEDIEYTDIEFINIEAPLIVIGEPGSGKSELLRFASDQFDTPKYNASTVGAVQEFDDQTKLIIVDGLDEITAYETGIPVNNILAKLPKTVLFLLSCRAADWQDAVNSSIINQKWHQQPVVGHLLPLNKQEIIDYVDANGGGKSGEEFYEQARQRDVIDLLKNPQNLLLLLKAIKNKGWPDSRLELYENASHELVQEDNPIHVSINRTRPAQEQLIDAAGFISAQLLLSGKTSIKLDGQHSEEYPIASELTSEVIEDDVIQAVLSTKLFISVGKNLLEPIHRTVSEYLAAKWIAKALRNQLSLRRLESILYGVNYFVPAAFRGLHAWIATLNSVVANKFIERDPYGFFRYGDPSALTIQQSQTLLHCLEKFADFDPYFRSEDWHATFGRGLARLELRDDIIRVIRNPESPYQLSHLIIESIQGDTFVDDISKELSALILDSSATPLERHAAVESLDECHNQPDWPITVNDLRKLGDIESLRIAIKIIDNKVELFNGVTIGQIFVETSKAIFEGNGPNYYGLGSRLSSRLSLPQLEECLDILSDALTDERLRDLEDQLSGFIQERLKRFDSPPADKLWNWVKNFERTSFHGSSWQEDIYEYFSQNTEYRQAIQSQAVKSTSNAKDLWMMFFHLSDINAGLWLREGDLIFHLNDLIEERGAYSDWDQRWKSFVKWGQINSGFTGEFLDFARIQATQFSVLSSHLAELERPPKRDYEKEEKERKQRDRQEKQRKIRERHQSYESIQKELSTGEYLNALADVAKAYLGRFSEFRETDSPTDRVIELVGSKTAPIAFQGLKAATTGKDIPSAREISELHTYEEKKFFIEDILIAHCAIILQSSQELSKLPYAITQSALAACHWDYYSGDQITSDVQAQLEKIVFSDITTKEKFVRDTVEPYLDSGEEHVSGLYRLSRNKEFSDIAGNLAVEWIEKYANLSNNSLRRLLITVIRFASWERAQELIRKRIAAEDWNDATQRSLWISTAFLLDFDDNLEILNSFAEESKDHLWSFRALSFPDREDSEGWPKLSAKQHYFLVTKFGPLWPLENHPSKATWGDKNGWDANQFIQTRISDLAADSSDEAEALLQSLVNMQGLEEYQNHIKHSYAQQRRRRAEANKVLLPLKGIKSILLEGEPTNHDDLQALLMDELIALQDRIRNSSTNDILPYWDDDTPHIENYCRDRIASALNPYLERYNVRAHTEGTRPDSNRCDLLITHNLMDVPIEIKGQWHDEIWTAAADQLQNYTREYHSKGRGIYLVLWFGYLGPNHPKNPRGWIGQSLPKTLNEMNDLLTIKFKNVSVKTKIFTLDLSKPS